MPHIHPGSIGECPPLQGRVVLLLCDRRRTLKGLLRLAVVGLDDSGVPTMLGEQPSCLVRIRRNEGQRMRDQLGEVRFTQSQRKGDRVGRHGDRSADVAGLGVVVEGAS
jgi:hypothetical protein